MPTVLVALPPLARMRDQLSFTMALTALAEGGLSDRTVPRAAVDRARPFRPVLDAPLPPGFFRNLHRIGDRVSRPRPS